MNTLYALTCKGHIATLLAILCSLLLSVTASAQVTYLEAPCATDNFTWETKFVDGKLHPGATIYLTGEYALNTGGHMHTNFGHPTVDIKRKLGNSDGAARWNSDVGFPCVAGVYAVIAQVPNPGGQVTESTTYFLVQLNRPMASFSPDPQIRSIPPLDSSHPGAIFLRREVIPQADSLMFNLKEAYPDINIALTHVGLFEGGWFDWDRSWHPVHDGHDQGLGFDARMQFNGPPEVVQSHIGEADCSGYSMGSNEWHIDCPGAFRVGGPAGHGHGQ